MTLIKTALASFAGFTIMGMAVPAAAQSSNFEGAFNQRGTQARMTLKIPLGRTSKSSKEKPRLHFGVRQYYDSDRQNTDWMRPSAAPRFRETSLSFSLEKQPQFFIGEQAVTFNDSETAEASDGVKTAGKVALGAGVIAVVVVGVGLTLILLDDESGASSG